MPFVFYQQLDEKDCGPTCLQMISKYYGLSLNLQTVRELCEIETTGVSLLGISKAAEKVGFHSLGAELTLQQLKDVDLPCILHWRQKHFVVLYKSRRSQYYIADPASGLITISEPEFKKNWSQHAEAGYALLLSPTPLFYKNEDEKPDALGWSFLTRYISPYRKLIVQLFLGIVVASLLQLAIPFLTQSIVDIGINTRNLSFITIVLIAQITLTISRISIEFIRSWILLHVSTRVNVSILTDFLMKLMKLPIGFFDAKLTGDIMQRMNDQNKIESFLTGTTLSSIFSLFNLIIFSFVLAVYNLTIFLVFIVSTLLYVGYILLFLKRRKYLNYRSFDILSKNQSNIVQLVNGMQEIKLNDCEQQKRWEWEYIQAKLFKFNVKTLSLTQYQKGGTTLINEIKNILITYLSARLVIIGDLSLGSMLAIQYIAGQLNGPVEQLLIFIPALQDAKISLERLNEIQGLEDEETDAKEWRYEIPENKSICFSNVSFRYTGVANAPILKNISVTFPEGKTTAIVGMSGSGKTTLLKLLLRFYEPGSGTIKVGENDMMRISFKAWRRQFGMVMQDGYIFSDSIERNIAVSEEFTNRERLEYALKISNLSEFIGTQPLGLKTVIGSEGKGISHGQRQRILIARAVYKNPAYLIFDEATNSLDANNEKVIMKNLYEFFSGKTVIIVAHRLSTVKKVDNIVVLDNGEIAEQGTHEQLIKKNGKYYHLIKDQLEIGS